MAPVRVNNLAARSVTSGQGFTVAFCLVAVLLLVACAFWGFGLPYIRRKYRTPSASRAKLDHELMENPPQDLELLTRVDSSHPQALREDINKPKQVHLYNPRYESPFPDTTVHGQNYRMLSHSHRVRSFSETTVPMTSNGLFTPIKTKVPPKTAWPGNRSFSVPRTRAEHYRARSGCGEQNFKDTKEYVLAVPERLSSRYRGSFVPRSPTELHRVPTRRLNQDKAVHPNKLFAALDLHASACVDDESTALKAQNAEKESSTSQQDRIESLCLSTQQEPSIDRDSFVESIADCSPSPSTFGEANDDGQDTSNRAMHRFETYKSLIGAQFPQPLTRAGTQTRPKTPVAILRDFYDRSASDSMATKATFQCNDTASTAPFTVADSSDIEMNSTPATTANHTMSTASLLPTPLRVKEHPTINLDQSKFEFRCEPRDLGNAEGVRDTSGYARRSQKRATIDHTRIRPRLAAGETRNQRNPLMQIRSASAIQSRQSNGSMRIPLLGENMQNHNNRTSSVYSRDTRGFSVAMPYTLHVVRDSTVRQDGEQSDKSSNSTRPAPNAIKAKVDDWEISVDGDQLESLSSKSAMEAVPRQQSQRSDWHTENRSSNRVSEISTDFSPTELAMSYPSIPRICIDGEDWKEKIKMRERPDWHLKEEAATDSTARLGKAPGDADWL